MAERPPFYAPPGHMPMVLLTPDQYAALNRDVQVTPYFALTAGARLGHTLADVFKLAGQSTLIYKLRGELAGQTVLHTGLCYDAKTLSLEALETKVLETIETSFKWLMDAWVIGNANGMGAAFATASEQFLGSSQLLYAYKDLRYQVAVTPRMRRLFNAKYTPSVPNFWTAWQMWRRGKLKREDVDTYASYDGWTPEFTAMLCEIASDVPNPWTAFRMYSRGKIGRDWFNMYCYMSGWEQEFHDKLFAVYETLPTAHEAFYMNRKGLITDDKKTFLYKADGYQEEWHPAIEGNFEYVPTLYDLARIADYVELEMIWALDTMKRRGMSEKDRAKAWEMLEIRPLRDEIRNKTKHATYCRQHGFWSKETFEGYLADMAAKKYIRPREKELLTQYGEDLYELDLKEEWIEILRWRFRTAEISEFEFLDGLVDPEGPVAMVREKANLIVEGEKAKGYFGYY